MIPSIRFNFVTKFSPIIDSDCIAIDLTRVVIDLDQLDSDVGHTPDVGLLERECRTMNCSVYVFFDRSPVAIVFKKSCIVIIG